MNLLAEGSSLIAYLLYHILSHLSRTFFRREVAFVVGIAPTLFQPVGSGSHLYPAHLHTMRSDRGAEVLHDSHGSCLRLPPCPPLLYPYCITTWEICQEVFETFFKGLFLLGAPHTPGVLWTPLDFSYIVSHLGRFVKGFLEIFSRKLRAGRLGHTQPLPTVRHLAWVSQLPRCSLPLTLQIIPHLSPECNWQNAQNRDFYFLDICATFLLTNCWRCVIMEISRPASVGAPPKSRLIVN